jgi:hypothetical protein
VNDRVRDDLQKHMPIQRWDEITKGELRFPFSFGNLPKICYFVLCPIFISYKPKYFFGDGNEIIK